MIELAARIGDGWARPLSAIEQAALAADPHVTLMKHEEWSPVGGQCEKCMEQFRYIRNLLTTVRPLIEAEERQRLRDEGLLLPTGSQRREQLLIRWHWDDGSALDWGADDMEHVRALHGDPPSVHSGVEQQPVGYEVLRKSHWAGPWEVVPEEEINSG